MANTLTPFGAARRVGVRRVVHISITNPSRESHLESFSGKARLEQALIESGMSYAILRPTVLFGKEDILCAANFRATAFYSLYALKHLGWSLAQAEAFRDVIWKGSDYPVWRAFISRLQTQFGFR